MQDLMSIEKGRFEAQQERGRRFMAKVKSDTDRVAAERDLEVRNA